MKKIFSVATLITVFGWMTFAFAAPTTVRGYVMDKRCSTNAAMKGNTTCVGSCLSHGQAAVLVEDGNGHILTIANKAKIMKCAGEHVALRGNVAKGAITVLSVRAVPAPKAKA